MEFFRKEPIAFEGSTYEIRAYHDDTTVNILTFRDNHPASGLRHQIQLPEKCDVQNFLKEPVVDEFMEMSKKDIIEKRGERLSAAIQKNMMRA